MTACSTATSDRAGTAPPPPASASPTAPHRLGHFPKARTDPFPNSAASALQEVLDAAVEEGLPGVSATVLVYPHG